MANERFNPNNMVRMLEHRMGWNVNDPSCKFLEHKCYRLNDDQAVVFIISGEKAFLIYDELPLYPSDALVTKLRMME